MRNYFSDTKGAQLHYRHLAKRLQREGICGRFYFVLFFNQELLKFRSNHTSGWECIRESFLRGGSLPAEHRRKNIKCEEIELEWFCPFFCETAWQDEKRKAHGQRCVNFFVLTSFHSKMGRKF